MPPCFRRIHKKLTQSHENTIKGAATQGCSHSEPQWRKTRAAQVYPEQQRQVKRPLHTVGPSCIGEACLEARWLGGGRASWAINRPCSCARRATSPHRNLHHHIHYDNTSEIPQFAWTIHPSRYRQRAHGSGTTIQHDVCFRYSITGQVLVMCLQEPAKCSTFTAA